MEHELRAMLERYGPVRSRRALFVPPQLARAPSPLLVLLERLGVMLATRWAAFIAVRVDVEGWAMVTCQFSLYPLREPSLSPALERAMEGVRSTGLTPQVGSMSTYIEGNEDAVFEALKRAFRGAAEEGELVLVATVSNACRVPTPWWPARRNSAQGVGAA
jgi:uncharacterized protein YqgV (UPF0045/DUF77 family)